MDSSPRTHTTANRKLRCSAGQGSYILCSKGLQAQQYSSSKQYTTTHHRAASIRIQRKKMKKWCCNIFCLRACRGKGILFREKKMRNENMLPVMTVLVRRRLGSGPDVALGQVGRMFGQFSYFSGVQCIPAGSYLPAPLPFPISNYLFPPRVQHKCLPVNSLKIQ